MEENKLIPSANILRQDPWTQLRAYTAARIALGRAGVSIPLKENLQFRLAHAYARDAVYASLKIATLKDAIAQKGWKQILLHSQCTNRNEYLQRPDKGRKLNETSQQKLASFAKEGYDIAIIAADGLSAIAIDEHLMPILQLLLPLLQKKFTVAPISIVEQGRVAIADEIGSILNAKLSIIFIGERPGLTSPNSMGAYITYKPTIGFTDERRNCISNIRPEGLPYSVAVDKIVYLVTQALHLQISGVELKEEYNNLDSH